MRWAGCLISTVVALSLACAGRQAQVLGLQDGTVHPPGGESEEFPTQRIFRVRYQDDDGAASFRLVGWLTSPEDYKLSATDPVGRILWAIDFEAPRTLFVDYRSKRACTTERPVSFPEVAMADLWPRDFALVLVGLPPTASGSGGDQRPGRPGREKSERDLTVESSDHGVVSWTLWSDREPLLWYRADPQIRILSHRSGVQFRWKETHRETLIESPAASEVPDGFVVVECRELAPPSGTTRVEDPARPSG